MSDQTTGTSTNNQRTTFTDTSKVFIGGNRYDVFDTDFTNSSYATLGIAEGTVFGQVAGTLKVKPLDPLAQDGSQYPIGILKGKLEVESGSYFTDQVTLCVAGDVAENKVLFADNVTTINTVVDGRTLRARIGSDTVGIKLVASTELTEYDND